MVARAEGSRAVQVGAWGALAAGAAFVIKVAQIFATDGADHPIQGFLYVGGMLLGIVGAVGVGAYFGATTAKKIGFGLLAFFLFMFFIMFLSDGIESLTAAVTDVPGYVEEELPVAIIGLGWLFVGYRLLRD